MSRVPVWLDEVFEGGTKGAEERLMSHPVVLLAFKEADAAFARAEIEWKRGNCPPGTPSPEQAATNAFAETFDPWRIFNDDEGVPGYGSADEGVGSPSAGSTGPSKKR